MSEKGNETTGLFAQANGIESPLAEKSLDGQKLLGQAHLFKSNAVHWN